MEFERIKICKDLIVAGGGIPGVVTAVQAARLGLRVALINNRGVLGGNSSAELDIGIGGSLGTAEFNNFSRESGIIGELLLENQYKNPQGNRYIWDGVLNEFIKKEKNIEVFLNTEIDAVYKKYNEAAIEYISGAQQGTEKRYDFYAPWFVDDTGNGTVGYLAGAKYRKGREAKSEFNERIAPEIADEYVIPSTLVFYSKDTGKPVKYTPPTFALNIENSGILQYRTIPDDTFWRFQWYYELGGKLDQVKDSQEIMEMHRALVYGIWDYVKNSGRYPADNYNLEYVSCVVAKRESRRLEGDYILTENDIENNKYFEDAIAHGGWSIDLHSIDGIFSTDHINKHVFLNGIYSIPFRCAYSSNIDNLFMVGRCMSTTHAAFGSTRVVATLSTVAQAVGTAAYLCKKYNVLPRGIYNYHCKELQQQLLKDGQFIPGVINEDNNDLVKNAQIEASSKKELSINNYQDEISLKDAYGLSMPVKGRLSNIKLLLKCNNSTSLKYSLYLSSEKGRYNPKVLAYKNEVLLEKSLEYKWYSLPVNIDDFEGSVFLELEPCDDAFVAIEKRNLCGCTLYMLGIADSPCFIDVNTMEKKTKTYTMMNYIIPCFDTTPKQMLFEPSNIKDGFSRAYGLPHMWMSDDKVDNEWLSIKFNNVESIDEIYIYFDANYNYSINYQIERSFDAIPEIVKEYYVYANGEEIAHIENNYQAVNKLKFEGVKTDEIKLLFKATNGCVAVGINEIRIYKSECQ